eukprot:CAMPEP_0113483120 /NCGR_PEP_ID=MMETSP0014_2-20120614/23271_1 /TAXON_ID=2857 /ORGANISM="Nitzschia sp." /LENGTH=212 /DNA_ID=CAMNT_0000376659 /DNA_START=305 /DNA_END=943 /DNA_ORIENTATION=- /assembly_acc=CAM_ASM_000159
MTTTDAFHPATTTTTAASTRARSSSSSTGTTADSSRPYSFEPTFGGGTVIDAPTKEDIDEKTRRRTGGGNGNDEDFLGDKSENFQDELRKQGPLEWLIDDMEAVRDMDDPFHILLLSETFEKPKITVPYVAGSLEYVLDMPLDEGLELSQFAYEHGMSCLGVWPREECLKLGRQLQIRDIVCRVVPYVEGGQRAWQAKDASSASSSSSSSTS